MNVISYILVQSERLQKFYDVRDISQSNNITGNVNYETIVNC